MDGGSCTTVTAAFTCWPYEMEKRGVVEVEKWGLALRCKVCRKTLSYPIGSLLTMTKWDEKKKEFVKLHNSKCGKGD